MTEQHESYRASQSEMRDLAPHIREILLQHVGRANAITADDIASQIGVRGANANRRIRMIIARMIAGGDFIGSSPHKPRGYWRINSEAEVREVLANWRNRWMSIQQRYKTISNRAYREYGIPVEQLKFEM